VQIAFASQAVEAKVAMLPVAQGGEGIFPEAIAMLRMTSGAIFFQTAAFLSKSPKPRLGARMHAKLLGLAFLGIAANQALFLWGLRVSTPFAISLLGATIPVLTAVLAVLFRKERPSWRTPAGLVMAVAGVLWLTGLGSVGSHDGAAGKDYGAMIVALNCVSFAAYVVFSRDVIVEVGSLRSVAWFFTYGALLFSPIGMSRWIAVVPHLTLRGCLLLAYIVAFGTLVAYWLHAWALARSSATVATIFIYMQPLFAGALARIQMGYAISSRAWISALFILGGVAVTTRWRRGGRASRSPTGGSTR
jgi:drug/metabolite transporter (DMT)-like permease